MPISRTWTIPATLSAIFFVFAINVHSQDLIKESTLDANLKNAFESLKKPDYKTAGSQFEAALAIYIKDRTPSEWLITRMPLPDEGPGDSNSPDPQVRQIMGYRHSMATEQALRTFLAFTCQLQGDKKQAGVYFDSIYKMQSLVWGTSWRAYIPPIEGLFHTAIKEEKSENFGLYLYRAGLLMDDAGQEIAEKFFVQAQQLASKNPEVAANLASYYVVRLRAAEARPLAQLSLSVNPKQAHVLIDLASAEWLLGDLDNALAHSNQAAELDPSLPGPHVTLVLVHIVRGENVEALKEAEKGVKLSERHFYYLAAQAIAYEAAGKPELAVKNVREAWNGEYPDEGTLRKMFLKDKPLELLLRVIKRAKA